MTAPNLRNPTNIIGKTSVTQSVLHRPHICQMVLVVIKFLKLIAFLPQIKMEQIHLQYQCQYLMDPLIRG